jgi:hypothetical protein
MRPIDVAARHGCPAVLAGVLGVCEKFPSIATTPAVPPLAFLLQNRNPETASEAMIARFALHHTRDPLMRLEDGTLLHYAVKNNIPRSLLRCLIKHLFEAALANDENKPDIAR